jgi:hypothetical protein
VPLRKSFRKTIGKDIHAAMADRSPSAAVTAAGVVAIAGSVFAVLERTLRSPRYGAILRETMAPMNLPSAAKLPQLCDGASRGRL